MKKLSLIYCILVIIFLKGMGEVYNLGLLPRKPFFTNIEKMNTQFNEFDRENAKKKF